MLFAYFVIIRQKTSRENIFFPITYYRSKINYLIIISFKALDGSNGPSESKRLEIVALSQNILNTVKSHEICCMFQRIGSRVLGVCSRVLGVSSRGLPPETKL